MERRVAFLCAIALMALVSVGWAQGPAGPAPGPSQSWAAGGGAGWRQAPMAQRWAGPGQAVRWAGAGRFGARRGRGFARMGHAMISPWPRLQHRLGLTADQAQSLSDAWFSWQKSRITGRAQQQIGRLQLGRLMSAQHPDESAVDQQLSQLGQMRLAATEAAVHYRLAVRQVLTPRQRRQLRAMRFRRMTAARWGVRRFRRGFAMHRGGPLQNHPASPSPAAPNGAQ